MYKGFHVKWTNRFSPYQYLGRQIVTKQKRVARMCLDPYINHETGALVGDAIERDWFPVSAYDVFVSHSHEDVEKVEAFVGWLQERFQLTVFVDSVIWGSADTLLEKIDDQYCLVKEQAAYDYRKRNFSTSHVHVMLTMVLAKVMDQAECFMFLHPSNAVQGEVTRSPWIYSELLLAQMLVKRKPKRLAWKEESGVIMYQKQLEIEHDVQSPMNDLIFLREENLKLWERTYSKSSHNHALDDLYAQFFEE